jgi:sulfur-carrier protein
MPTVHLPSALSGHAAGQRRVQVAGATVGNVLAALGRTHPGVGQRVLDDRGVLRRHVNVFVNGESIRYLDGVETPVGDGDEVWILPAVSGGCTEGGSEGLRSG